MGVFSFQSTLYRSLLRFVILGLLAGAIPVGRGFAQSSHGAKVSKGPRALGLIELAPNGKAQLIPVAILYDGKFYDAGAYKADPVPMALQSGTVYEGVRTGASQGLFTVTAALENQNTNVWIAEGTWMTASEIAARSAAKPAVPSKPRGIDQDEGPPKLRRAGSEKPAPPPAAPPATSVPSTPPQTASSSSSAASAPASAPAPSASAGSAPSLDQQDKNVPVLKRGKPATQPPEPVTPPAAPPAKTAPKSPTNLAPARASQAQVIAAISDADGPEPRPYIYSLTKDEEQKFRTKLLVMAADEIRGRAKQLAGETTPSPAHPSRTAPVKAPQPNFEDVQLHAFDLSNSNEPDFVLSAKAQLPPRAGVKPGAAGLAYFVTLVVREDVNGDLHKALANTTDSQHLDLLPRYELIDAVDADGDGRGELLFRQVSDTGSVFAIYRVIGNQLWPLYQGTAGE